MRKFTFYLIPSVLIAEEVRSLSPLFTLSSFVFFFFFPVKQEGVYCRNYCPFIFTDLNYVIYQENVVFSPVCLRCILFMLNIILFWSTLRTCFEYLCRCINMNYGYIYGYMYGCV